MTKAISRIPANMTNYGIHVLWEGDLKFRLNMAEKKRELHPVCCRRLLNANTSCDRNEYFISVCRINRK